jgi:hypothetical protein
MRNYKISDREARLNQILDRILSFGLKSLTKNEIEFLEAWGNSDEITLERLLKEGDLKEFKSSDGKFLFTFSHTVNLKGTINYFGRITVPNLTFEDGSRILGSMNGYISVQKNGDKIPFFQSEGHDIIDFCNGLEYELDNFIDYVIETLNDEKNSR